MNEEQFIPTFPEAVFYGLFWAVMIVVACGLFGMMVKTIQAAYSRRKVSRHSQLPTFNESR
jgi:hypothetical protein